jgi:hypothetical protein
VELDQSPMERQNNGCDTLRVIDCITQSLYLIQNMYYSLQFIKGLCKILEEAMNSIKSEYGLNKNNLKSPMNNTF